MGEYEGWEEPGRLFPNGLLPNAGPVVRVLESERWLKAEGRTAELIACIQPNPPSEEKRNAVADYVQRLIVKCFPCQVFTFGSVPLKTYLPDGDIDLTAFSNNLNLKDMWPDQVRDMLEKEERNGSAEFCVKEVQYIQAEVKIVKCLVENIVVDISFNQLGGLCTLCFLEEVDNLINQNHLFKRSIILIKAWCYYESRILGAHHGLISTYALETLVLYIFHVFNNSFAGPLEVLYRFLEFFSNFDWDNFCVSLWGPVPISSLPDVTAKPPCKDGGELLLRKPFLDACSSAYAVFPGGQENQGQPFVSKHFNVIDPLRVNNNLGRSVSKEKCCLLPCDPELIEKSVGTNAPGLHQQIVYNNKRAILSLYRSHSLYYADYEIWLEISKSILSSFLAYQTCHLVAKFILFPSKFIIGCYFLKSGGNFFRIRSAFVFGARRLARLLDCPKENLIYEVNQFFMNTWDRHTSGCRPGAPAVDLRCFRLSTPDCLLESENVICNTSGRKANENSSNCESEVDQSRLCFSSSQQATYSSRSTSRTSDFSMASKVQNQKNHIYISSPKVSDHNVRETRSNLGVTTGRGRRNLKSVHLVNDVQGRLLFARTRSSPELTDVYRDPSSQGKHGRATEDAKVQGSPTKVDNSSRRKNFSSQTVTSHSGHSLNDDSTSVRRVPSNQNLVAANSNSDPNSHHRESGLDGLNEELASTAGTQGMQQEEQDLVNMMTSASLHGLNGQVHMPFNLASPHLPFPISPSFLASLGYNQRNIPGMVPANIPLIDPSFTNLQFLHGFVSPPFTHYFPSSGVSSTSEDPAERNNDNFGSVEINHGEFENEYWQGQYIGSTCGFDPGSGKYEMLQPYDRSQPNTSGFNFDAPSWVSGSGSSTRFQERHANTMGKLEPMKGDHVENFQFQDNRGSELYNDERTVSSGFSSAAHSNPLRSKTSSESSWDGLSTKTSKSIKEKGGKGFATEPTATYVKGKLISEPVYFEAEDDAQEWNSVSEMATEITERSSGPQSVSSLPRYHASIYETSQASSSDSMIPIAPLLIGPGSRERMTDNSGLVAFYPTGPPVPFLTMLPVHNIPTGTGTLDSSTCHFEEGESLDNHDSGQNLNSPEVLDQSEDLNTSNSLREIATTEAYHEHKSDILNSDFASHWQNLQFGRFCQNPSYNGSLFYPSPLMVPPAYLHGQFPREGPGRPISANSNLSTQLMGYGPHLYSVASLQSVSIRPSNLYRHYVDDMPRYRSGTGTYLPNPVSVRERHSSGTRRGNHNYNRYDNRGDREGNWRVNLKSRAAERNLNRSQSEKSNSRLDRFPSSESRADRSWSSYRHDSSPSNRSRNGVLHLNSTTNGPPNVPYGMYPLQPVNTNGVSSNGPTVPPVVMLYPFDHNSAFQQLEFGSLGSLGFSSMDGQSQLSEGNRPRALFEEHKFHGGSVQRSSPDQPSSPHRCK